LKKIAVIGAGGPAKVVISTLRFAGFQVEAIFDDDPGKRGLRLLDVPVLGPTSELNPDKFNSCIIAVGQNRTREKIASQQKLEWITAIHPQAWIDPSVKIGAGTVVFAGAVIQPDTVIGDHVIVNTGATIDHDCVIGDFVHLAPGVHLAGDVQVGRGTFVGIGSVAIPGIRIGKNCVIGAGSAVIRNVADSSVTYGVPAKARKSNPAT
jgi:sugar O-acyltransferase (sialic acid O-acetyltransferase NeuD family)